MILAFWDWARRVRTHWVLAHLDTPGRLLDVGCGRGDNMLFFQRLGWDVYGTELTDNSFPTELKDRVFFGDIRDGDWQPGTFDGICFWNSLEHLPEPRSQLAAARNLLAPGGSLFIEVPNLASLQAGIFGRHWFHLDPPRHLHHFRPEALAAMLANVGFSTEQDPGISHEYEAFGWIQSAQNAVLRRPNHLYVNLKAGIRDPGQFGLGLFGALLGVTSLPFIVAARLLNRTAMLRYRAWY